MVVCFVSQNMASFLVFASSILVNYCKMKHLLAISIYGHKDKPLCGSCALLWFMSFKSSPLTSIDLLFKCGFELSDKWHRTYHRRITQTQNHSTAAERRNNQEFSENIITATKSNYNFCSESFEYNVI